jgi:transcriptional regulator with GAF, ATPase, and Fis domain
MALNIQRRQSTFLSVVLRENNGNQVKAAKELSMHRNTLHRHITDLDLDVIRASRRRPSLTERVVYAKRKVASY